MPYFRIILLQKCSGVHCGSVHLGIYRRPSRGTRLRCRHRCSHAGHGDCVRSASFELARFGVRGPLGFRRRIVPDGLISSALARKALSPERRVLGALYLELSKTIPAPIDTSIAPPVTRRISDAQQALSARANDHSVEAGRYRSSLIRLNARAWVCLPCSRDCRPGCSANKARRDAYPLSTAFWELSALISEHHRRNAARCGLFGSEPRLP